MSVETRLRSYMSDCLTSAGPASAERDRSVGQHLLQQVGRCPDPHPGTKPVCGRVQGCSAVLHQLLPQFDRSSHKRVPCQERGPTRTVYCGLVGRRHALIPLSLLSRVCTLLASHCEWLDVSVERTHVSILLYLYLSSTRETSLKKIEKEPRHPTLH